MEAGVAAAACFAFGALTRRDISFVSDDRVDAGATALAVEFDCAVQIAVIGQRQGIHAEFFGLLNQFGNPVGAVQQRVMAMAMEMRERTFGHGPLLPDESGVLLLSPNGRAVSNSESPKQKAAGAKPGGFGGKWASAHSTSVSGSAMARR